MNVGDKAYLYYSGNNSGNAGLTADIGVAMLRRDGFGYLGIQIGWSYVTQGSRREGELITAPIRLHDKNKEQVLLNLDNVGRERDQWVKVEILDENCRPIPGYTLEDSDRLSESGIAVPVTWKGSSLLSGLPVDIIRLRILLHGGRYRHESPRLYAVYFRQPKDIEQ